jgi:hypothetical protein
MPFVITRIGGSAPGTVYSGSAGPDTGAEVVYVDRTSDYTVTPTVPGWQVAPATATVSASTSSAPEVTTPFTLALGTTTSLAMSPSSTISIGTKLTLTATISPASGTGSGLDGGGTATVTFFTGSTSLGDAPVTNGSGGWTATLANLDTSSWSAGPQSLTARYNGTGNFAESTSTAAALTVAPVQTTTLLTVSPSSVALADKAKVTLTATVTVAGGGTVAGTVTFMQGTTTLGTTGPVTVSGGTATLDVTVTGTDWKTGLADLTAQFTPAAGSTLAASTGTTTLTIT